MSNIDSTPPGVPAVASPTKPTLVSAYWAYLFQNASRSLALYI